ncbi:AAA-ATPase At5g57480-like [Olea europaea var. sylvestris]|uniref:AAA-ATPase At5g57480-like n=1 Tax=Olea europaea subsp. europaea TaxID=158383 RepID=A0A8S0VGY0_OLEEU|nr:AAA-ATPase At5g57480-like [Olea europaea var. sylvestris]CAA3030390.1 AAA-ATPase At5g57480-like [Olea europaea subsp. europaea]
MEEFWTTMASMMGFWAFCQTILYTIFPPELRFAFLKSFHKIFNFFTSYCYYDITEVDGVNTNELYNAVQLYLSSSAANSATRRLSLSRGLNSSSITFSLSNNDRVVDSYNGVKVAWEHVITQRQTQTFSWRPLPEEKRGFILRAKNKDKTVVLGSYIDFIVEKAKDLRRKHQDRLLYTNSHGGSLDSRGQPWESVPFKHPGTFNTLAMDPLKKAEIMADLLDFANGESFYQRTGRAWKRGYLLYGPPGTGKSSMIAAMANYLGYDIYDLELTEVNTNSELRKLLMKTSSKSIIVIEDIDCSINFTIRNENGVGKINYLAGSTRAEDGGKTITLSGLLNFTDGLWSCCGNERIFVFTTNHVEKLDPALLRSGRMDMHIHMSYCSFSALKILFKNYLGCEDDQLDGEVLKELEGVIDEAKMTPADISEVLIKNRRNKDKARRELLEALKTRAERNRVKPRKMNINEDEDEEQERRGLYGPKQDCDLLQESCQKFGEKDDDQKK